MDIGFTGTRKGMTDKQKRQFKMLLKNLGAPDAVLRHGDCIGADAEANGIARELEVWTVAHPPDVDRYRAFCEVDNSFKPTDYLSRNRHIVDATDLLVAAPETRKEQRRSGTWSTVRYARSKNKRIIFLNP